MRISQLVRALKVNSADVIAWLEREKGMKIENGVNEKLDESTVKELKAYFESIAPGEESEDWTVAKKKEEKGNVASLQELGEDIEFEEKIPEDVEHIKPEIPNLEGPKILDKIDLPEPKEPKKEVEQIKKEEPLDKVHQKRKPKRKKRELTEEQKEERRYQKELKAREEKQKKLKELRKQEYLKKVQQKAPQAKKKDKPKEEILVEASVLDVHQNESKTKKGWFSRAIDWLVHAE